MRPWLVPVVLVLLALAIRAQRAAGTAMINQDSPHYLGEAAVIHQQGIPDGWKSVGPRKLVATLLAPVVPDARSSPGGAVAVCILFGSLAVLPLMSMTRHVLGRPIDMGAGLLYAVHPLFVDVHSEVLSEGIAHLFLAGALACLAGWFKAPTLWRAGGAAVASALAALCRPDGAAVGGAALILMIARTIVDRPQLRGRLAGTALFALLFIGPPAALLTATGTRDTPPGEALKWIAMRYAPASETPERPEGWKISRYVESHGREFGTTAYLGQQLVAGIPLALTPFIVLGILHRGESRRGALMLAAAAVAFIALIGTVAYSYMHRTNSRYFSLPYLLLIPVAATGLAALCAAVERRWPRGRPAAWIWLAICAVLLIPNLEWRRYEHVSERMAWESMSDRRGEELRVVGGTWVRAEYYAGIRSASHVATFTFEDQRVLERAAAEGRVDAILILDCNAKEPGLNRVLEIALKAWPGYEMRQFPPVPNPHIHTAKLYLRAPPVHRFPDGG